MAELLSYRTDLSYFLFLDADMGVINPNHLIEEYMAPKGGDKDADLTFYERSGLSLSSLGAYRFAVSQLSIAKTRRQLIFLSTCRDGLATSNIMAYQRCPSWEMPRVVVSSANKGSLKILTASLANGKFVNGESICIRFLGQPCTF